MKPTVSIVILNYNGKHFLKECIPSVLKQNYDMRKVEIILVDNCSEDGSVNYVKQNFRKIKIIKMKSNVGFATGNNEGYKKARGKYVILLNNDTIVPKDWLKDLMNSRIKDNDVAIVGSFDFPIGTNLKKIKIDSAETINLVQSSFPNITRDFGSFYAKAYSCIIKKSVFDRPFDNDYFIYAEDIYLGWIAHLKGYKVFYEPKSKLWHHGSATMKKASYRSIYFGTRNRLMNFLIFYKKLNLLRVLPLFITDLLARFVFYVLTLNFSGVRALISAILWVILHPFRIIKKRSYVQEQRKVSDNEIIKMMSYRFFGMHRRGFKWLWSFIDFMTFMYCKLVGLKTHEFYYE